MVTRRILVVEDNEDARESLAAILRVWGYLVEEAKDGPEGFIKALAWHPDAVIADIGLPGLDGYSLAERLRSLLGEELLLIAHTGYGQPLDRAVALQNGYNVHFTKPLDLDQLALVLSRRRETAATS